MTARIHATAVELESDVLVIGGGMAGAWAAAAASRAGGRVVLVDKGYCGTSGVTAAGGPGHWWVPPDPAQARDAAVAARLKAGLGLGDGDWMHRIIDQTWRLLPTLAPHYRFPVDDRGIVNYRGVRGPEYMRALRALILERGVRVLDHHPALELLARPDGSVGGAAGIARQDGNRPWRVRAGAVVLAAGGTSFLSHLLGSRNNTGDGYLMAAEAGAEMSGMEFTAAYTIAPAHSTMTRTMAYSFATYYDADGNEIDVPIGPAQTERIARALLAGPVFCSLHRLPEDIQRHLPTISPNVMLPFARWGVDPFRDRFEVTLHNDGTIRGLGGVRVVGADCATSVPGLFVAGDNASREKAAGAISGGGNVNAAWALASGTFSGTGAAAFARVERGVAVSRLTPLGQAGLRPRRVPRPLDILGARAAVRGEMHPYEKTLFRRATGLAESRRVLDGVWSDVNDHAGGTGGDILAGREIAALVATARWSVTSALARAETRGLHRRLDAPATDPRLAHRILSGGLDMVWTAPDAPVAAGVLEAAE